MPPEIIRTIDVISNLTLKANGGEVANQVKNITPTAMTSGIDYRDGKRFLPYSLLGWRLSGSGSTQCLVSELDLELKSDGSADLHYSIRNMGNANASITLTVRVACIPDYVTRASYNGYGGCTDFQYES